MKSVLNALVVSAVCLSTSAFAQGAPKAAPAAKEKASPPGAAAMPAPTMTPEGKKFLEMVVGNWSFKDGVMKMGDQEMKGLFTLKCEKAVMGWAVECKGTQDMGKSMPKIEGLYVMAWDVVTNEGHMLEVESMGNVHDHVGKWADDKNITLTRNGKNLEGKEESDAVTLTFTSPREMMFKAEGKSGTTTNWTFMGTGKK